MHDEGFACTVVEHYVLLFCSNGNIDNPERGDIRLFVSRLYISLSGHAHGRVELYLSGAWIVVTVDSWTTANSQVACRQLGYLTYGECYNCNAQLGHQRPSALLQEVLLEDITITTVTPILIQLNVLAMFLVLAQSPDSLTVLIALSIMTQNLMIYIYNAKHVSSYGKYLLGVVTLYLHTIFCCMIQ